MEITKEKVEKIFESFLIAEHEALFNSKDESKYHKACGMEQVIRELGLVRNYKIWAADKEVVDGEVVRVKGER